MVLPASVRKRAIDDPSNVALQPTKSPAVEVFYQLERRQDAATEKRAVLRIREDDSVKASNLTRAL